MVLNKNDKSEPFCYDKVPSSKGQNNTHGNSTFAVTTLLKTISNNDKVVYYNCNGDGRHFIYNKPRNTLRDVSAKATRDEVYKYSNHNKLKCKVFAKKDFVLVVVSDKHEPQVFNTINRVIQAYNELSSKLQQSLRYGLDTVFTEDFKLIILDVISLMVSIREAYSWSATLLLNVLLQLYTMFCRYKKIFTPQAMNFGFNDLMIALATIGLPEPLRILLKDFNALTGKRLTDTSVILESLDTFRKIIIGLLDFFEEKTQVGVFKAAKDTVDHIMASVNSYSLVKKVTSMYTEYVKNSQIMLEPSFREAVLAIEREANESSAFNDFILNSSNRSFVITWNAFKDNVIKMVKNYESSRKTEPICIVFEGKAGQGKSKLMNEFTTLLTKTGLSVYTHTVPPVDSGKDFYDDYENQDVFVMDDVGQQGVSQWRTLINFVSPVKYPLECANANKKNTKFFNSKIILCTTNNFRNLQAFTKTDSIAEPEALFRRAHVIDVSRESSNLTLKYFKYDHISSHKWESRFLHHNDIKTQHRVPVTCTGSIVESLTYMMKLYLHLEIARDKDVACSALKDSDYENILESVNEVYYEAQGGLFDWIPSHDWNQYFRGAEILTEWTVYLRDSLLAVVASGFQAITDYLATMGQQSTCIIGGVLAASLGYFMYNWLFGSEQLTDLGADVFEVWKREAERIRLESVKHMKGYTAQSLINTDYEKFSKLFVIKSSCGGDGFSFTHGIVSGKNILFPAHLECDGSFVDIYSSWEHYQAGHKEMEAVKVKLVKAYYQCDMAVYRMLDVPVLYKKCRMLFNTVAVNSPLMFIINVGVNIPVVVGSNTFLNKEDITYTTFNTKTEIRHSAGSGYETPIGGLGFCGTMLVSREQGIIGMHVAGAGSVGFCVVPSAVIANELRRLMHVGEECEFELDKGIIPSFSGVRLRYQDGEIQKKYPIQDTSFVPTVLHRDVNEDMEHLIRSVENTDMVVGDKKVTDKGPPIFEGDTTVVDNLLDLSKKSFKHTGHITDDELEYIKQAIDLLLVDFDDLTIHDTTFGNDVVARINPKSSNGYGLKRGKNAYINYDDKTMTQEFLDLLKDFEDKCYNDKLQTSDVLSTETFKDELRAPHKRKTPRTFRVLPLPHIWWTKRIFGNLMKHFSDNLHKFGVSVGLNPFKDFHEIYSNLKDMPVTSDIDFKWWDGTLSAQIMLTIRDALKNRYKGEFTHVLDAIFVTITRSRVLVFDALYQCTHGLPSGTWITLLLNCLVNKAITALVFYRNGSRNPADFLSVKDYVMGDDKLFGTPEKFKHVFNSLTVKKVAEQLGMECTNGDKTPITVASQPLSKVTFVKRAFKFHPVLQRVVGCLSADTIINTMQWYDSTKEYDEVMEGKIRAMQVEAYLHSKVFFDKITALGKKYHPFFCLFDEEKVVNILNDDQGYIRTMRLAGKDLSFNNIF